MLRQGASALVVVAAAVVRLVETPLFNAGRGSVLNSEGGIELDAAIMDGATRGAGAVAGVQRVRNPVLHALRILRDPPYVLFCGAAGARVAQEMGLECVDPSWFVTPEREAQLEAARRRHVIALDHDDDSQGGDSHHGTVGCVARDAQGRLAAATSTGGLTNKPWGRIGDSPLIGAGTWANDRSIAVSCTGLGEAFIRSAFASQVHGRLLFGKESLDEACRAAFSEVTTLGGRGGALAIERTGRIVLTFTTRALYRAWVGSDGRVRAAIGPEAGIASGFYQQVID
jgi:beta-aspartyl-peptidase (threonine type)